MFLLIRKISEYTHHDIILGIFNTKEKADLAKSFYIKRCNYYDKWREQAYREVNLDIDILVQDVSDLIKKENYKTPLTTVYVVSCFIEGFGQVTRFIEAIFETEAKTKKYIETKRMEEPEYQPTWHKSETLNVNEYYFNN